MTTRYDPHGKLKDILSDVRRLLLLAATAAAAVAHRYFIGCWPHSNELEMNLIYFQLDLQHIFNLLSTHTLTQHRTRVICQIFDFFCLLTVTLCMCVLSVSLLDFYKLLI